MPGIVVHAGLVRFLFGSVCVTTRHPQTMVALHIEQVFLRQNQLGSWIPIDEPHPTGLTRRLYIRSNSSTARPHGQPWWSTEEPDTHNLGNRKRITKSGIEHGGMFRLEAAQQVGRAKIGVGVRRALRQQPVRCRIPGLDELTLAIEIAAVDRTPAVEPMYAGAGRKRHRRVKTGRTAQAARYGWLGQTPQGSSPASNPSRRAASRMFGDN